MSDDRSPGARPTALLIVNPAAHRVTDARHDEVARVLEARFFVERAKTKAPGHAGELAASAVEAGVDLVVALGGDGTVNEAANALAGTTVPLAVLPGGEANVLARSIGLPRNPVRAAQVVLSGAATPRPTPLGRAAGRWFTINCGVGLDAAVVRAVEARPRAKDLFGDSFFVWSGLRVFFGERFDRRTPHLSVRWGDGPGGERLDRAFLAIVQNVTPFTYLGPRAIRICPEATLDAGLDVLTVDSASTRTVLGVLASALGRARHTRRRHVAYAHDRERIEIRCDVPMPVQVDGEYVGERTEILVESVPDALRLVR